MTKEELASLLDDIEARELERTPAARLLVFGAFEDMQAQIARMREALKKVEWLPTENEYVCPWCRAYFPKTYTGNSTSPKRTMEHIPDCPRQAALAEEEKP